MHPHAHRAAPRRALLLSLGLMLLALGLQWSLRSVLDDRVPFIFFFPAMGIAAMWFGWRYALVVLAGGLAHALFWMQPAPAESWGWGDAVAIAGYLMAGGVLLFMGDRLNQLRRKSVESESTLASQVSDLQALHELGNEVMVETKLPAQLTLILQTLSGLQGAHKGLVSLLDLGSGRLSVVASLGFSPESLAQLDNVAPGDGACGTALQRQRTVIVDDAQVDPCFQHFRELVRDEGFRAVHSRPLFDRDGRIQGVMSLHFRRVRRPSARDNQLGDLCAQMASVLAERERVRLQAQALTRKVEVALQSSAVPFSLFRPVVDGDGTIVDLRWEYANTAAAAVIGREESDLVGRTLREVLPGIWERQGPFHNSTRALREKITVEFEWSYDHNGLRRWFQVIASPCDDGLAMWFSNVTRRKRQQEALQEADRRKDEFLATLAHELRNPLAPIRQAALIARSQAATQAQLQWALEIIERQVSHMALLLDDLLDVSRITRGKLELRKTVTDLAKIAESALETARPGIEQRQQRLVLNWPDPRPLWSLVDPMRISQVLSNLLANASKYTPVEGEIRLSGRRDGDEAVIEISDNGIGIAPEALEEIFQMFTQVKRAKSAPSMGLGIGLALSRGIVALHGGSLTARSEGADKGSTFTLRLALCEAPDDSTSPGIPQRHVARPRRVLVADDNRDAAESLAEILRMEGHEVTLAFDGETALRQFNRTAPDVALLDIGMPRMSGNEVASAIRSLPGGDRAMLVAITGWGQDRDRTAAKKAGFDFHFTKPIDPDQVLRLMDDAGAALETGRDTH